MAHQRPVKGRQASERGAGKARKRAGGAGRRSPPVEMMTLSDLDQLRVLADPLRVRIIEALAEERTTKQVAERIGEKPTKLYHHVDALERVGLIRLTRTRRVRGTLERYYQVVAFCFRADASLFPRRGGAAPVMEIVSNLLGKAANELQQLAACCDGKDDLGEKVVLSFVEVRGPQQEVAALRQKLKTLLEDLQRLAASDRGKGELQCYRLMLGYYPLVKPPSAS